MRKLFIYVMCALMAAVFVTHASTELVSKNLRDSEWINSYLKLKNSVENCKKLTINAKPSEMRFAAKDLVESFRRVELQMNSASDKQLLAKRLGKIVIVNEAAINHVAVKFNDEEENQDSGGFFVEDATPDNARRLCAEAMLMKRRLTVLLEDEAQ